MRAPSAPPGGDRVACRVARALLAAGVAGMSAAPPAAHATPGAAWVAARSRDAPVHAAPSPRAPRRGSLRRGAPARATGAAPGPGCAAGWVALASGGFVCGDHVHPSPPPAPAAPGDAGLLPAPQAFVAFDATPAYAHPSDARLGRVAESLGEGFSVVVVGRRVADGVDFVETRRGLFVEASALRFARPSAFAGADLGREAGAGLLPAFALRDGAAVHARPGGRRTGRLAPRAAVATTGETRGDWVALAGGGWVRDRDVARARPPVGAPADVAPGERWLEVDLREQVVVARVGARVRFATLASTGRRGHDTPTGVFRVWAKLASSDMSDLERTDVARNYALEAVPWVLYFSEGVGFHAAFWHDDFGRPRSHGCVNLAPRDARWLFDFAEPSLPRGWSAILPTEEDPGTRVWVHR